MTVGTVITLLIIIAAVALIVARMVRARRAGRSMSCEECPSYQEGGCPHCAQADDMLARVNAELGPKQGD